MFDGLLQRLPFFLGLRREGVHCCGLRRLLFAQRGDLGIAVFDELQFLFAVAGHRFGQRLKLRDGRLRAAALSVLRGKLRPELRGLLV